MISELQFCYQHFRQRINIICTSKHEYDCDRKLCAICFYEHFNHTSQIEFLTIKEFCSIALEKISEIKGNWDLQKIYKNFKAELSAFQNSFIKIQDNIINNFLKLFEEANLINQEWEDFIGILQRKEVYQCNKSQINHLIENLLTNRFSDIQPMQLNIVVQLNKVNEIISQSTQKLNNIYKNLFPNIIIAEEYRQQNNSWELLCNQKLNIIHGQSYYQIQTNHNIYKLNAGNYSFNQKNGNWEEMIQMCRAKGRYRFGRKDGYWMIFFGDQEVGGGEYNYQGLKVGLWKETFCIDSNIDPIISECNYEMGIKVGEWSLKWKDFKIGEGKYDKNGKKIGNWTEIYNQKEFKIDQYLIQVGSYKNEKKIGKWEISLISKNQPQKSIGGGSYSTDGFKAGAWKEIEKKGSNLVITQGEYCNDKKIGNWSYVQMTEFLSNQSQFLVPKENKIRKTQQQWLNFPNQFKILRVLNFQDDSLLKINSKEFQQILLHDIIYSHFSQPMSSSELNLIKSHLCIRIFLQNNN